MKKNNDGYSLVEIIIVIAIMMILTGGIFYSVNMVFGANAKTCANDLRGAIAQCKINAMGKSDAALEIFRDSTNQCIYARQWTNDGSGWNSNEREKISNARVGVTYTTDGASYQELDDTHPVFIGFDRSSGSFQECTDPGTGVINSYPIYQEFRVTGGSRSFTVELTRLTGKVSVVVN